ncbi:MAG: hypothetical protein RLZZ210_962 [Pseudomonadota bacterium]|jgi:crossover junction endodeoxyribonuclease RuvC
MLVLGIDPGLKNTGFGLIKLINRGYAYIGSGTITTCAKQPTNQRLVTIFQGIQEIIQHYKPEQICMEKIFLNVNPKTTLLLGQARGVAICAATISVPDIYEYTPLQIKQTVVGYGHASKEQVQEMVKRLLKLNAIPQPDAADALACALTHIQYNKFSNC